MRTMRRRWRAGRTAPPGTCAVESSCPCDVLRRSRARRRRDHHEAGIALTPLRHAGAMTRTATRFMCIECGVDHAIWAGQCTACAAWNTVVEATVEAIAEASPLAQVA